MTLYLKLTNLKNLWFDLFEKWDKLPKFTQSKYVNTKF